MRLLFLKKPHSAAAKRAWIDGISLVKSLGIAATVVVEPQDLPELASSLGRAAPALSVYQPSEVQASFHVSVLIVSITIVFRAKTLITPSHSVETELCCTLPVCFLSVVRRSLLSASVLSVLFLLLVQRTLFQRFKR